MDFLSTIIYHLSRIKALKFPIMNNIQKILIMVFFMSVTIFIITAFIYSSRGSSIWQYQVFTSSSVKIGATYEMHTNWFGIIALANAFGSLVGFFLFKDKK